MSRCQGVDDASTWPTKMLLNHLDEIVWRKLRSIDPDGLLAAFLSFVLLCLEFPLARYIYMM